MKPKIRFIISLAAIFLLYACDSEQKKEAKKPDAGTQDHAAHVQQATTPSVNKRFAIKDDELNAVFQQYQHLATALTNGKVAEAKIASNALEAGATQVQGGKQLSSAAARIVEAPNIESQRAHFAVLSNAMIDLVKKSGVEGELYVDYCPMALNDKGAYWLSTEKEIRNPYYGEEMLTCGEVKETIK